MNVQIRKNQKGFTLIELMIVVAIIGILAAIAIPAYQNYMVKSRYAEVINAASGVRASVDACAQIDQSLANCENGKGGVLPDQTVDSPYVDTVKTGANGVITVTPKAAGGIVVGDTYVLKPTFVAGKPLTWAVDASAGCLAKGLCK
jgi:type IV pilus assembly protein PilA